MNRTPRSSLLFALLAAMLFGMSAPLAKLLLGKIDPILLASFLYLGSGFGLLTIKVLKNLGKSSTTVEAKISRSDLVWLAGATLAGGVVAPIVLLYSLDTAPAATASLLLNFESVATTLIAAIIFREAVSRRAWWAVLVITAASILLSVNLDSAWGVSLGALGILAACFFWGIDNNLTRNFSAKDPLAIVTIKGLVAGAFSLVLALLLGSRIPAWDTILKALVLGNLSYGLSITLYVIALRGLGAARTSALFSTSPLSGLALSFILYRESPGVLFLLAFPLMVIGTIFLVYEEHDHTHAHKYLFHDHAHIHKDRHHDHPHGDVDADSRSHSHTHEHPSAEHNHHHMPDIHHRHDHSDKN